MFAFGWRWNTTFIGAKRLIGAPLWAVFHKLLRDCGLLYNYLKGNLSDTGPDTKTPLNRGRHWSGRGFVLSVVFSMGLLTPDFILVKPGSP